MKLTLDQSSLSKISGKGDDQDELLQREADLRHPLSHPKGRRQGCQRFQVDQLAPEVLAPEGLATLQISLHYSISSDMFSLDL